MDHLIIIPMDPLPRWVKFKVVFWQLLDLKIPVETTAGLWARSQGGGESQTMPSLHNPIKLARETIVKHPPLVSAIFFFL